MRRREGGMSTLAHRHCTSFHRNPLPVCKCYTVLYSDMDSGFLLLCMCTIVYSTIPGHV